MSQVMKLSLFLSLFGSQLAFAQSENFVYDPTGLRDPFSPPKMLSRSASTSDNSKTGDNDDATKSDEAPRDPILAYQVNDYKLMAVLWDVKDPRALLLAPNGKVYTVRNKSKVGREGGTITSIQEQEVRFQIPLQDGDNKKTETRVIYLRH